VLDAGLQPALLCAVTNVTRYKAARELLLQPGRGLLQALAAQLRAPSLLRRRGAAGTIRNCCMSAEVSARLLLNQHNQKAWSNGLKLLIVCQPGTAL
jgi:hypothetical protein